MLTSSASSKRYSDLRVEQQIGGHPRLLPTKTKNYSSISVAADAIQVDSARVSLLFWVWMSDNADEDVLYVELGLNGFGASLRGVLVRIGVGSTSVCGRFKRWLIGRDKIY